MQRRTLAVVGLLGAITVAAFVAGVVATRVSAQGIIHVLPVRKGGGNNGGVCRDMTNDLRNDRDASHTLYLNWMDGFITGANYVSYLVPGRNSDVSRSLSREFLAGYSRGDDAVFALLEQWCAQNPAKNIWEGATRVYSQLYSQPAAP
jgi:hypothetical protein